MSNRDDRKSARSPVWLVGKVQGGMEFVTAGRLRRQGVRVKCPGYIAFTRPGRLRTGVKKAHPAYPGYIFIDRGSVIDLERICMKTKGFMCVVSFADTYSSCDDAALTAAIEYKRKLERENFFGGMPARVMKQRVKAGAVVRISDGPFRNYDGKVTHRRGNNIWLNIEVFGKQVKITVHVADVVLQSA